jgi:flagellar motor switch protein FliM
MSRVPVSDDADPQSSWRKPTVEEPAVQRPAVYDFRRPDRIAREQLRSIHQLHDNFARNLASSLSGYLRAYVVVNLVSVEQLSFAEFTQCLPSPTVLISLGMKPFDNSAVLEINPSLVFPLLEMLLGGNGKGAAPSRETTEIEQSILDTLFRIIVQDLTQAWQPVANIGFTVDARETEPQLLQILAPNEAVVSVGFEMRVGDHTGLMNIGLPSIMIKMLRHRFDQQWSVRKDSTEAEHARVLKLLKPTGMRLDARLEGPALLVEDLMTIEPGHVLNFDYPVTKPLQLEVNGRAKFEGRLVASGNKKAFQVDSRI